MNYAPPASRKRHPPQQLIAILAIVVIIVGSLLIIERLQKRLVDAEQQIWLLKERIAMMNSVMHSQGRRWKKMRDNAIRPVRTVGPSTVRSETPNGVPIPLTK